MKIKAEHKQTLLKPGTYDGYIRNTNEVNVFVQRKAVRRDPKDKENKEITEHGIVSFTLEEYESEANYNDTLVKVVVDKEHNVEVETVNV